MKIRTHSLLTIIFISSFYLYSCGQKTPHYDKTLVLKATEINFAFSDKRGIEAASGIIYLVEKNMQTLTAYQNDTILWKANILENYPPPLVGKPEIRFIRLDTNYVFVTFGKHCFANVDISNGSIKYLGCD
jgi:hypothetical protein